MKTLITAHSGCDGTVPGSSGYLHTAMERGADLIELDLRLCGRGVYVSHDPVEPERLGGCLRLEEALALLEPCGRPVNCDLKEAAVREAALELLRRHGMEERTVFTGSYRPEPASGGTYRHFLNVGRVDERLAERPLTAESAERLVDFLRTYPDKTFAAFNLRYQDLTPEAAARLDAAGVRYCCWTVDDLEAARKLLERGVYAITTNRLTEMLALRTAIQGAGDD